MVAQSTVDTSVTSDSSVQTPGMDGRRNFAPSASARTYGAKGSSKGHHSKKRSDAAHLQETSGNFNSSSASGSGSSSRKSYQQERRQLKKSFANSSSDVPPAGSSNDSGPRVLLLRNNQPSATSASASPSRSQSPVPLSQGDRTNQSNTSNDPSNELTNSVNNNGNNWAQMSLSSGKLVKLLDGKTWTFWDDVASLLSPIGNHFKVVSSFGFQASGKSTAMNVIAGKDIFPVHGNGSSDKNNRPCPLLQNVTSGIDMVITSERLFLLDSQPLLSASILDQMIESSTSPTGVDVNEVDAVFLTSLQLLSFLLFASDCLILTSEPVIDASLIHLMHDAVGRIGVSKQLNIVWYFNKPVPYNLNVISNSLDCIFGRGIVTLINGDPKMLLNHVLRLNTGREVVEAANKVTEKGWFNSAQRFWDNLVKKPSDFSRFQR